MINANIESGTLIGYCSIFRALHVKVILKKVNNEELFYNLSVPVYHESYLHLKDNIVVSVIHFHFEYS